MSGSSLSPSCRSPFPKSEIQALRRRIWKWWKPEQRSLPWRGRRDPWAIWVAEVMLQQTRAEVVAERFDGFLSKYPCVESFAAASSEDALAAWSGLGYYRRARSLHAAAQQIRENFGGVVPDDAARLRALPGFGDYTTAAVASIAFGHSLAAVDGNIERLLVRLLAEPTTLPSSAVRRRLSAVAQELLDPARPGDWNQALMDLGSGVCRPRAPRCEVCPWRKSCGAFQQGTADELPRRVAKRAPRLLTMACVVVRGSAGLLLFRRDPDAGWMPGMWEFPTLERADSAEALAALVEARTGLKVKPEPTGQTVMHSIVDRRLRIDVWAAKTTARRQPDKAQWLFADRSRRSELGLVGVVNKIVEALESPADRRLKGS